MSTPTDPNPGSTSPEPPGPALPEAPPPEPTAVAFDLRARLAELLPDHAPLPACTVAADVPDRLLGNPSQLLQTLAGLVGSAPGEPGGGTVCVEREAAAADGVWLHFSVRAATAAAQWEAALLAEPLGGRVWADDAGVVHLHARFSLPTAAAEFDRAATLGRVGDDPALLLEVVELFQVDSVELLGQVRAGLAQGDTDRVRRACHSLKGQVLFFGAGPAAAALARLHRLAAGPEPDRAVAELPALEQQLQTLRAHLRTFAEELSP